MILNSFEIEVFNTGQLCFKSGQRTLSQIIEIHAQCLRKYFSDFETNKTIVKGNYMMHIYSDAYIERMKKTFEGNQEALVKNIKSIYQIYTKGHMSIVLRHSSSNLSELQTKKWHYDA